LTFLPSTTLFRSLEEYRLAQNLVYIDQLHRGRRHARKGRELIHHAANIADLPDDGLRALLEDFRVGGDFPAIFPAQALCRKLDRRERVLDLMRDTARHIRPGGRSLRAHEFSDVIKGENETALS